MASGITGLTAALALAIILSSTGMFGHALGVVLVMLMLHRIGRGGWRLCSGRRGRVVGVGDSREKRRGEDAR